MKTKAKAKKRSHEAASSMFISQSSALRNRTRMDRQPDLILSSEADGVAVVEVKRLSDPTNRDAINSTLKSLSSDKAKALEFLQSIGVASSTGTLTKRFGG